MTANQTIANKPIIPGAGVDPRERIVPSKRVKSWHRSLGGKLSLKTWLRNETFPKDRQATIEAWFDSKGCSLDKNAW